MKTLLQLNRQLINIFELRESEVIHNCQVIYWYASLLGIFHVFLIGGIQEIPQNYFFFTQIRRAVSSVRQVLSNKFVPNHLGFKHITRDAVISEHTRPLAKELFSPTINKPYWSLMKHTYMFKNVHSFPFKGGRTVCRNKGKKLLTILL